MKIFLKAGGLAIGGGLVWLFAIWPPPVWYRTHWPAETAFMWMRRTSATGAKTEPQRLYHPVPLDSITKRLQDAVIIGEDNNFLSHGGIDYLAMAHALGYKRDDFSWSSERDRTELFRVLPAAWSRRDELRGASTISQQLAKNLYLSPSRNPFRKLKEAVTTYRLESALDKPRIMELYLNVVELGDGVWGAEAASRKYFKRGARALSEDQAAALAGSLPFPLTSNPGLHSGRMRWRQALILRRMHGEWVEVPKVEAEEVPLPPPPDSIPVVGDSMDLTEDTIVAPVDTLESDSTGAPADSAGGTR